MTGQLNSSVYAAIGDHCYATLLEIHIHLIAFDRLAYKEIEVIALTLTTSAKPVHLSWEWSLETSIEMIMHHSDDEQTSKSIPWTLAEFRHNRIVQSPHENYFNVCRQHKEKWSLTKTTIYVSSRRNSANILFKLHNQIQGV